MGWGSGFLDSIGLGIFEEEEEEEEEEVQGEQRRRRVLMCQRGGSVVERGGLKVRVWESKGESEREGERSG